MGYIEKEYEERDLSEVIKEEFNDNYTVFYNITRHQDSTYATHAFKIHKIKRKYVDMLQSEDYYSTEDLLYNNLVIDEDEDSLNSLSTIITEHDCAGLDDNNKNEHVYILHEFIYYTQMFTHSDYTEDAVALYNNLTDLFNRIENVEANEAYLANSDFELERSFYKYNENFFEDDEITEFELTAKYEETLEIRVIEQNWNDEEKKLIEEKVQKIAKDFDNEGCQFKRLEISY